MGKVSRPSRVRFVGPLVPFAAGFADRLEELRYKPSSACGQLRLAAHFSGWLLSQQLDLSAIARPTVIAAYLVARRESHTNLYSEEALRPVLAYLVSVGVVDVEEGGDGPGGPVENILDRFRDHLLVERTVSRPVADAYTHWVRPFVATIPVSDPVVDLPGLDGPAVARFLTGHLVTLSAKSAQMTTTAMRAFLRFAFLEGLVGTDLTGAVPAFAFRNKGGVPRALTPDEVAALMASCDTSTPVGRRDLAVIILMLRLGLRCQEVAALEVHDFDWATGTVRIPGKGGRRDRLPLPVDVGEAVVAYLRQGRPSTSEQVVFLRVVAPLTPLGSNSVSCVVARAARRAGLGTIHAHRLRHTAASRILNAGASLEEVAQLLRHASPATTSTYAKTDRARLVTLARPWPGSKDQS